MNELEALRTKVEDKLKHLDLPASPADLYAPMQYILSLGGKRMRPVLLLLANRLFGGNDQEVIGPAAAIEVFHNFTLVHDDIMDEAPLRRGQPTVHTRWNTNIGILSGDALMVKAYQLLAESPAHHLPRLLEVFSRTALEVCEGQQFDMDFESQAAVSEAEYLEMIRLKTAVLLGAALEMGAVLADASAEDQQHLRQFGVLIGVAFQLQDDILDAFADQSKFGKQVGGDIIANKKTILQIKSHELASAEQRAALESAFKIADHEAKVSTVLALFEDLHVKEAARSLMSKYHDEAMDHLTKVSAPDHLKAPLRSFADQLYVREF